MSTIFDRDSFADAVGSKFTLTPESGPIVDLELTGVSELRKRPGQQSFSIFFEVPEPFTVGQGLYDLQHEKLGAMQLFLVPILTTKPRQELEALFNFTVSDEG